MSVSLREVMDEWSLLDMLTAHEVLDLYDEVELDALPKPGKGAS